MSDLNFDDLSEDVKELPMALAGMIFDAHPDRRVQVALCSMAVALVVHNLVHHQDADLVAQKIHDNVNYILGIMQKEDAGDVH